MFGNVTFAGLLQAAAVLTVIFSLATGVGIEHRSIELFSHFRLQYLIVSVLLLMIFAIRRDPAYALALLVAVGFNASLVLPWYFGTAPASSGTPLKIVHSNVLWSNTSYQRLIDFVHAENPDIIFLQEVTPPWIAGTKALLQNYPYSYLEPRGGSSGIAMYSRIKLDTVRHVDSPPRSHPTIIATVTIDDETLTLISTHPTIPINRSLYAQRNEQLQSIAEIVNQVAGNVILLGDFNASMWDPQYQALKVATGMHNTRQGFGIVPTWPTQLPFAMIPIDHALVSDGISVVETRTGSRIGSDHLPLIVSITM